MKIVVNIPQDIAEDVTVNFIKSSVEPPPIEPPIDPPNPEPDPDPPVDPSALDQYGGYTDLPIKEKSNAWSTAKIGNRWFLVTPDGNAFISLGVYCLGDGNDAYYNNWTTKYAPGEGTVTEDFCHAQLKRLRAWGFNSILEYYYANCGPYDGAVGATDENKTPVFPFPINGGDYSRRNVNNLIDGHVKELIRPQGWNVSGYGQFKIYGAKVVDYFDPRFKEYIEKRLAASYSKHAASPWTIAFSYDEGDITYGFSSGPGWGGNINAHVGLMVITCPPTQTMSPKNEWEYTDTETYSKTALKDFLKDRYETIEKLNAAWGSNYTTFESDGEWGVGKGLLDEDGRRAHKAWLGTDNTLYDGTCADAVQTDLGDFLYLCADHYFKTYYDAINDLYPHVLQSGPTTLGSWRNPPRKEVLQAAGKYLDIVRSGVGAPFYSDKLDFMVKHLGKEIPMMRWTGGSANEDSALHGNKSVTKNDYATQEERGEWYKFRVKETMEITNSAGTHFMVGLQLFSWVDHSGEKTNWGLVTFKDNAYDGKEAVIEVGTDADGFAVGGEDKDYGDFITSVINAHNNVSNLIKE